MKQSESDIQYAICEYLAMRGYFFFRENNVAVFDRKDGRFRAMPKYSMYGVSDILLLHDGTLYAIEVKTPRGRQSAHQKRFQEYVENNGGVYLLVTSIDDVQQAGL